jgi:hypothetical protein
VRIRTAASEAEVRKDSPYFDREAVEQAVASRTPEGVNAAAA